MPTVLEIEDLPIRVTADGRWLHGGAPMHPRVAELFARCVVPEPGGGHHLEVAEDRAPIEVDDTPWLVRRLLLDEDGRGGLRGVILVISDGAREPLDPRTLAAGPDHVLYCRIVRHGLSVPCRFPPSLYHRLALHVEESGEGHALRVGGVLHPIGRHRPGPLPL